MQIIKEMSAEGKYQLIRQEILNLIKECATTKQITGKLSKGSIIINKKSMPIKKIVQHYTKFLDEYNPKISERFYYIYYNFVEIDSFPIFLNYLKDYNLKVYCDLRFSKGKEFIQNNFQYLEYIKPNQILINDCFVDRNQLDNSIFDCGYYCYNRQKFESNKFNLFENNIIQKSAAV